MARFAIAYVDAHLAANRSGLGGLRTTLAGEVEPAVVEAAIEAWCEQGAKLVRLRREVGAGGRRVARRGVSPTPVT